MYRTPYLKLGIVSRLISLFFHVELSKVTVEGELSDPANPQSLLFIILY